MIERISDVLLGCDPLNSDSTARIFLHVTNKVRAIGPYSMTCSVMSSTETFEAPSVR